MNNPYVVLVRLGSTIFEYKNDLSRWFCLHIHDKAFTIDGALLWVKQAVENWRYISQEPIHHAMPVKTFATFFSGRASGMSVKDIARIKVEFGKYSSLTLNYRERNFKEYFESWSREILDVHLGEEFSL